MAQITRKDQRWLDLAGKFLKRSNHPKYRVASVLVRGGSVISHGVNRIGSAYRFVRRDVAYAVGRHAEIYCIFKRKKRSVRGAVLYVVGDTVRTGYKISTKPCAVCQRVLALMGISKVIYQQGASFELLDLS